MACNCCRIFRTWDCRCSFESRQFIYLYVRFYKKLEQKVFSFLLLSLYHLCSNGQKPPKPLTNSFQSLWTTEVQFSCVTAGNKFNSKVRKTISSEMRASFYKIPILQLPISFTFRFHLQMSILKNLLIFMKEESCRIDRRLKASN